MILSHRHKFIFFCNGKTGSTSIEAALRSLQEGEDFNIVSPGFFGKNHVPPAILKACLSERVWRSYYKAVFVRNPWDWFVSNWVYNKARRPDANPASPAPSRTLIGRARRRASALAQRVGLVPAPRPSTMPAQLRFVPEDADYLYDLLRRFRGLPSAPTLTQTAWAYDPDGNRLVDFVGRFERLQDDFAAMCRHVGIDARLGHLNRTEHDDYRSCFTDGGRERVAQLWHEDIHNFNYTF